ncbi:IS630 family transposase [Methylococcus geothermalis]|uniref:IS630 family transposase n=1 Tax=Methylococcus geothermalis TaxID=2681310 RepID=A0A858Q6I1_9GAMM|nr:IS630 family transposase [Methylococcus geothermalis]QJD29413.1 IS630 family transposase [Methylococcus geothermalis]QJD30916.1 IS630 family transposase [Methylococcus geothermalis]
MEKVDARKLPREAQDEMRRQAMRMRVELKLPWREIARVVGVNINTVIGWSKRYSREGESGLKSKTRGRRYLSGRTLTLAQEWQLRSVIVGENPKQLSLPFALWNRRAVMQLVKVLFGIDMPIRTVGEYLLRWGYTPQRPMKRALEQNPVKVEQWRNDTYPAIAARAKAEGAVIYWGDETAVAEDGHWLRGDAPVGQTPVLAAPSKRHGLSMVSAISNQGLVRFEFTEEAMNTDWFIGFMTRLIADSRQKVFLILDNLKVHHAKRVTAWLAERKAQIEVFYLPPYSPEINPDEYLNRDFKTELRSSDRATSKKMLLQKANRFMEFLRKTPERVMAYFNHSAVQYAAFQDI